jgi:nucleoside phosphorylase
MKRLFHPPKCAGMAGSVDALLQPGDVVVPEAWIHQAEAVWANRKPGTRSDLAGGQNGYNQEEQFGRAAARNAAAVTRCIVELLLGRQIVPDLSSH